MVSGSQRFIRVLLVEDDIMRIEKFRSWIPDYVKLVEAMTPGRAIGVLQRDFRDVYAAILLDHDLQQQVSLDAEARLSGSDVVELIVRKVDRETPILVHSMNLSRGPHMANRLRSVGFWVTVIPFNSLTEAQFVDWIDDIRSLWLDK